MTDKEKDRIIKANIQMAGFILLVKRMREAQERAEMISGEEDITSLICSLLNVERQKEKLMNT